MILIVIQVEHVINNSLTSDSTEYGITVEHLTFFQALHFLTCANPKQTSEPSVKLP